MVVVPFNCAKGPVKVKGGDPETNGFKLPLLGVEEHVFIIPVKTVGG
jgi:hypothetical protein